MTALTLVAASLQAQRAREWQLQGIATLGRERFVGGGLGIALRTDGRMRLALAVNAGDLEGTAAVRSEATVSYHLNPFKRSGVSPYVVGGAALVLTGDRSGEYLLLSVGLESRPGAGTGWFLEAGVGGGIRLTGGLRLRRRTGRR